jgi:hypothetical protein
VKTISDLMKLSCILGFFGLSACSNQSLPSGDSRKELAERVRGNSGFSVCFVGNSYSFGVPREFSRLAAANGRNVSVGHATYGGWSLKRHAANEATLRKIRSRRWDVVVLQEQSEIPAMPARKVAAAMFPPLRELVAEVRKAGAVPVLYQTWGRRDGDPKRRRDDFHAMNARLRSGYQAAAEHAGGLVVVPVGDAWECEVDAGRGAGLFMEDGSHPTPAGNALTAGVFFETLFGK